MKNKITEWKEGLRDGIPIGLGYLAVSFTFGIAAKNAGLGPLEALVMSCTNFTSAGQFAGLSLISISASYLEMAVTQLIINLRYCLMSCSLSQKLGPETGLLHRFVIAFGNSDEVFGVSVCRLGKLSPFYTYGLMSAAVPGWGLGTLLGILSGSILPVRIIRGLSIALYCMFIAVIMPPAKKSKIILCTVLVSMVMSLLFSLLPILKEISAGFKIIILTLLIAGAAAYFFPIKEEESHEA